MRRRPNPLQRLALEQAPPEKGEAIRPLRPSPLLRVAGSLGRLASPRQISLLRGLIHRAGLAGRIRAEEVFGLKLLGVMGGWVTGVFFGVLIGWRLGLVGAVNFLTPIAAAAIGFFLPDFWLNWQIVKRRRTVFRTLPDFVDLLATSVEAGLGLDAAIDRISHRFPGPLGEEFQRYLWEVQLGRPRTDAMMAVAERMNIDDLRLLTAAMAQAELFGTPIVNVLRAQAEELRNRRFQQARERAMRAPVLMVPALALCFCPVMVLILVVPLLIRIRNSGALQGIFG